MADTDTLWAVVVGAVLAAVGGFTATRLEAILDRRERERAAALVFGEVLSVLELITTLANQARQRGDPYGPITMRLLRAMRREIEVYDRNRQALYDLRDAKVRAGIHALVVRMTLALDGVLDTSLELAAVGAGYGADDAATAARIEGLLAAREAAFEFAMETTTEMPPLIASLRPLARHAFDAYASMARDF